MREGLTYDDVLLVPKDSGIRSRKDADLSVELAIGVKLKLPIITAPMDTVTESSMAIAVARMGGLGIIHRFNTIEAQAAEVTRVKRVENHFVDKPVTISPRATLKELLKKIEESQNSSFLVVNDDQTLAGIISRRDYVFESDLEKSVSDMMTPFEKLRTVPDFIPLDEAKNFFKTQKVEKLPVVDAQRKVKGIITAKDVVQSVNARAARDVNGRLLVGAAIGVKADDLERATALVAAGVDILVLDVAHGHLQTCLDQTRLIKKEFPKMPLIVGNIATREAAKDLREAGADVLKVGIGPGAACTTRIVTGFGVPQLTAVMEAKQGAGDIPIIADGGIRHSGDMVKGLAAGAAAVMMGSLFAGTDEAPGRMSMWNGRKVKLYRGMASLAAYKDKNKTEDVGEFTAEGVDQGFVPYKGPVRDLLLQWEGGMRSGLSYAGARTIKELWARVEFIKITNAAMVESHPHDLTSA